MKTGTDDNGNDVFATQTYKKVKISAQDQDIFDVAQTIGSLESTPIASVLKAESFELVNQE